MPRRASHSQRIDVKKERLSVDAESRFRRVVEATLRSWSVAVHAINLHGGHMQGKRIVVKVRRFGDRRLLQLQYFDATGRRRTQSAKTADEQEAEQARGNLEYRLNHGLHVEAVRTGWEAFREAFEAEYVAGKRENTRLGYAATFDLFERLCAPSRLEGITARTLSQFVAALRQLPGRRKGSTYNVSTINLRLDHMAAALSWAVSQGMLASLPELPVVKVPRRIPQPVPREWVDRLLREAGHDLEMRAYILCAWLAGLRRNEAYYLSWEPSDDCPWISRERRKIIFPAASVKAGDDQWVPLDPALQAALDLLPTRTGAVFRFGLDPLTVGKRVTALASRAGLRLTYRSLRRGFGCVYAVKVPAQVLQKLMRHSDIKTTLTYYCDCSDAMDAAIFGHSPEPTVTDHLAFQLENEVRTATTTNEGGQTEREAA